MRRISSLSEMVFTISSIKKKRFDIHFTLKGTTLIFTMAKKKNKKKLGNRFNYIHHNILININLCRELIKM